MRFITAAAISKRTVTMLAVVILLAGGVYVYNSLRVELFPDIEFPLVAVNTSYPSVDPEGVVKDVTSPIEKAISGMDGLESVQSTSFEGNSLVLANFKFGTDMANAERNIESAVSGLSFPVGVERPDVGRFNPDQVGVLQFSVIAEPEPDADPSGFVPSDLAVSTVQTLLLPELVAIDGVMDVQVTGEVQPQVLVAVDPERLEAQGISLPQVSAALSENNVTLPTGLLFGPGEAMPVKTIHLLGSIADIRNLVVGSSPSGPVLLSDVASVASANEVPTSVSRTNGRQAINVSIIKEPEANTIEVTEAVREVLDAAALPAGVEIVIVSDEGPEIQEQIDSLLQEAGFGFLFAVTVVFIFMLTIRPTVIRGLFTTLRPTIVIGLSIPLSVLTGVLLMGWQDMSLNFMTLGGLAISVGRVVDDAIVVLENVYRHIQSGRERWRAALDATAEVGPAIFASTLTTIVVFIPLAFIQGLVGAFFLPFALTISFALVASLVVALTAVPVLGAYLLRPGDLPEGAGDDDDIAFVHETWMQRAYTPVLRWVLGHKAVTLAGAALVTGLSLVLLLVIPVTLFPSGGTRSVQIEVSLPPGARADQTLFEVVEIEDRVRGLAEIYTATVGATDLAFGGGPGGFNQASILVVLRSNAPEDIAKVLREDLEKPDRLVRVNEVSDGPPQGGVDISITGPNYADIRSVAQELSTSLSSVEGVVNLESDVAQTRDEVAIRVDSAAAANIGLTARQVGFQLSGFLVGRAVTTIDIDGQATDVVLSGQRDALGSIDQIKELLIKGPGGVAPLHQLARVEIQEGPVTITRTDGQRSARITGDTIGADTQAVGAEIDAKIAALSPPAGVSVTSGGIFADIEEGFRSIFVSMAVGIILMYLVMVASLGSLRNPLIIVSSLPLALIGVLVSLAITGRALGLPAMMGILLLIGIVVTNAIVLIAFVEQLRARGMPVREALITGARVRLRPILMTALTTSFALLPLAAFSGGSGGIISSELATVVIGGLITSTALTLIVVPIVYYLVNVSIPGLFHRGGSVEQPQ